MTKTLCGAWLSNTNNKKIEVDNKCNAHPVTSDMVKQRLCNYFGGIRNNAESGCRGVGSLQRYNELLHNLNELKKEKNKLNKNAAGEVHELTDKIQKEILLLWHLELDAIHKLQVTDVPPLFAAWAKTVPQDTPAEILDAKRKLHDAKLLLKLDPNNLAGAWNVLGYVNGASGRNVTNASGRSVTRGASGRNVTGASGRNGTGASGRHGTGASGRNGNVVASDAHCHPPPNCNEGTEESFEQCTKEFPAGNPTMACCINKSTFVCQVGDTVQFRGGGRKTQKWINTKRTTTVKSVKKTMYRSATTGELRVRKMVSRPDGRLRATYVKF